MMYKYSKNNYNKTEKFSFINGKWNKLGENKADNSCVKVVFVGTPNVGKSSLINSLSGSLLKTGNWPGVTLEKTEVFKKIKDKDFYFIDLPGTNFLESSTLEERIPLKFLFEEKVDIIVNVVEGTSVQKNLPLSLQLKEFNIPIIIALNHQDEFKRFGFEMDTNKLEELLQLKVKVVSSRTGFGIEELLDQIYLTSQKIADNKEDLAPKYGITKYTEKEIEILPDKLYKYPKHKNVSSSLFFQATGETWFINRQKSLEEREFAYELKNRMKDYVKNILIECKYNFIKEKQLDFTRKLDKVLLNKYLAPFFAVSILTLCFAITFSLANPFIDFLDRLINSFLSKYLSYYLVQIHTPDKIRSFLIDGLLSSFGIITSFIPLIFLLNLVLIALQGTGYVSRIAFVFEGIVGKIGISGRAIFPLLLGFGCNVPTIYSLKFLKDEKEKLLSIFLCGFISCGARLPVYGIFAAAFFPNNLILMIAAMYVIGIFYVIIIGFILKRKFVSETSHQIGEMPLYRAPFLKSSFKLALVRTGMYFKRIKLIVSVVFVIWCFGNFPGTGESSLVGMGAKIIKPVFEPLGFGSRWEILASVPSAIIAKEGVIASILAFIPNEKEIDDFVFNPLQDVKDIFYTLIMDLKNNFTKDIFTFIKTNEGKIKEDYGQDSINRLSKIWDDKYAKLRVISFMIFILLTVPCVVALNAIRSEFSVKIMMLAICSYFFISYFSSLIFFQGALFLTRLFGF